MIEFFRKLAHDAVFKWRRRSSRAYIEYLRRKGIKVGDSVVFRSPESTRIDVSRPSLVSIGNNVDFNSNFVLMTHDYASLVFRAKFGDFVNSSGRVAIGSNVYFGINCTVLKGVTIGDNCVIAAGAVVSRSIPENSVAAGVPARVICSIDEFYKKRKQIAINEAFEYIRSIEDRFHRMPTMKEMYEEFIYFRNHDEAIARWQLMDKYDNWVSQYTPPYENMEELIAAAKNERV